MFVSGLKSTTYSIRLTNHVIQILNKTEFYDLLQMYAGNTTAQWYLFQKGTDNNFRMSERSITEIQSVQYFKKSTI